MSNSKLATVIRTAHENGYYGIRTAPISKITIHHTAGILTAEQIGVLFQNPDRWACSNYGIGYDGTIGLYAGEQYACGTSGSYWNDNQAITIEVSNDEVGGNWHISDKSYKALIDLCVDICKRNKIKKLEFTGDKNGSLTCHYMYQATQCPGSYLKSKMREICMLVNARLNAAAGDVDGNGKVNLQDAVKLQKYIAKWKDVDVNQEALDVNKDGKVNLSDVNEILRKVAKNK